LCRSRVSALTPWSEFPTSGENAIAGGTPGEPGNAGGIAINQLGPDIRFQNTGGQEKANHLVCRTWMTAKLTSPIFQGNLKQARNQLINVLKS